MIMCILGSIPLYPYPFVSNNSVITTAFLNRHVFKVRRE